MAGSRSRTLSLGLRLALLQTAAPAAAADTQQVAIVDPVFNLTAYTLTAPTGWHAEGTVLPPASCDPSTPVVFRATSPDGSEGRERLPSVSWAWGAGIHPKADCDLAQRVISAADFLTYYARESKVGFVKSVDIPAAQRVAAQHAGQSIDQAAMIARYTVGKARKPMEELIEDAVVCSDFTSPGAGENHVCNATVVRSYAPLGKLDALLPTFRSFKLALDQTWMNAWTAAMSGRVGGLYASQTKALLAQGALAESQRMQAHQDYMASMQQSADRRNITFEAGQYQKQSNSDNYVDYILDCQRSYGGNVRISGQNCPNRQTF